MLLLRIKRSTLLLLSLSYCQIVAQSFPQTAGWRDPLISLPYSNRSSLAQNALNITRSAISLENNSDVTHAAGTLYALSEFDRRSSSSTFQDNVTAQLVSFSKNTNFSQTQRLGLAYHSAHLAYPESTEYNDLLGTAINLWGLVADSYVTSAAATAGSLAGISGKFNSTCPSPGTDGNSRESVAGAVSFSGPPGVNGETIGPWITLSSRLYTSSTNSIYMDHAATSIQFVKTFLSNGTMIFDGYDFNACSRSSLTVTYNGGYFLQGLSAYYKANSSAATAQDLEYLNELAASLILFPLWTESDGINIEDALTNSTVAVGDTSLGADWKSILVEGLYQCLEGGFLNETVANLTQQYISVQYNAVRELANYTVPNIGPQVYGLSWNGVSKNVSELNIPGQLAASELFVTALGVGPVASTGARSAQQNRSRLGAIVGGTVGGVVVVIALSIAVLIWRRRKRVATVDLIEDSPIRTTHVTQPYLETNEQYPMSDRNAPSSKRQHSPLGVRAASGDTASSDPAQDSVRRGQAEDEGMVPVDASALQRLLLSVGGALSDLQRRGNRGGGEDSSVANEPPPDYEPEETRR